MYRDTKQPPYAVILNPAAGPDRYESHHQYVVSRVQERFGLKPEQAEREVREFEESLKRRVA